MCARIWQSSEVRREGRGAEKAACLDAAALLQCRILAVLQVTVDGTANKAQNDILSSLSSRHLKPDGISR